MIKRIMQKYKVEMSIVAGSLLPVVVMGEGLINPLQQKSIGGLIKVLVDDVLVGIIAPVVITLALVYSGFKFVTAQGSPNEIETAKKNFLYVLAGAVLLLGASVLLDVVTNTVNQL